MLRTYTRIAAVVLLVTAIIGLVVLEWRSSAAFFHLGLALLYGLVGLFAPNHGHIRGMVLGLGVLMVSVKAVEILVAWLAGRPLLHGPIEISCLVVGITSILAARYLPNG